MSRQLTLSQAFEGMILEKRANGASAHTIVEYRATLQKLRQFLNDDPPLGSITRQHVIAFLVWLRDEYRTRPNGSIVKRAPTPIGDKTRRNVYTNLSALWTWAASVGLVESNIVRTIEAPAFAETPIAPLTREEIAALLKACDTTRIWRGTALTAAARPTAQRDRLILFLLLDTGVRASELCGITFADLNMNVNSILIHGKGNKQRTVRFGKRAARLLWLYVAPRLAKSKPADTLIVVDDERDPRPMNRHTLDLLLRRLGDRAGVKRVHPHRFRHTFATNYLRNHGSPIALQELLGHADMEMVRRYVHFVDADIAADHETASPVDNWRL